MAFLWGVIFGAILNATYQELHEGLAESRKGDLVSILQSRSKSEKDHTDKEH